MSQLTICAACSELVPDGTCLCPHCGNKACAAPRVSGPALLLGLSIALTACPSPQPKYGVPDTGGDTGTPPTSREVPAMVDVLVERSRPVSEAPNQLEKED